jgi:hypothetical protein
MQRSRQSHYGFKDLFPFIFHQYFSFHFFHINRVGLRVPRESKGGGWVSLGCREEGYIQQMKGGEGDTHSYTGHWRRRQSFEHRHQSYSHHWLGVTKRGSDRRMWAPDAA